MSLSWLEKIFKRAFWAFAGSLAKEAPFSPFPIGPSCSLLALRPDRLGDFMLSLPALAALAGKIAPSGRLTIVAGEANESLARTFFPGARVLVFKKNLLRRIALYFALWRGRFDVTIDFHSYPFSTTSSFMTLLSESPCRIGFWAAGDSDEYREISRKIFNNGLPAPPENLPESSKSFLLAGKMLGGRIKLSTGRDAEPEVDPALKSRVGLFFRGIGHQKGTRLLGIHPTLQKPDNRWAPQKYVELLRHLKNMKNLKVIVIHGKGERENLKQFKAMLGEARDVFYLPEDDVLFIREAAKRLKALVCGDSGIMHACSGVTRILAIFGPSEPSRWGPLDQVKRRHVLLRKKDRLCDSVDSKEVARAVYRAFKT